MAEFERLKNLSPHWDWCKCAVIARKWEYLDPVRSFCEIYDIPVQMGNEEPPGFWRLRETSVFVQWLRGRKTDTIVAADLKNWLDSQPGGCWNDLLHQAVEEYSLETDGSEVLVVHFIEWLAEWGRQIRRRQRGLLLLTAHRAKGLEFDHVVVLDGDWNQCKNSNDADEQRRLYYVAMTRARKTLALACFEKPNQWQEALSGSSSVIFREQIIPSDKPEELSKRFIRLTLGDVYLDFAGSRDALHSLHRSISALSSGDPLRTRVVKGRWELLDSSGTLVGKLARKFEPPDGMRCTSATVLAVVTRNRDDSKPPYRDGIKCDKWEVVVPELVFESEGRPS